MNISPARRLLAIFAIMTGFLLYMAIDHNHRRNAGTEIVLDMKPVDPRSLFRGHYVRIATDLHTLEPALLQGDDDFKKGQKIYVTLGENEDGVWAPIAIFHKQPSAENIFIQGIVLRSLPVFTNDPDDTPANPKIRVQYNIESYFADEASAKQLEQQTREHKMRLILSLGDDGRAVIKGIEIDGQRQLDTLW